MSSKWTDRFRQTIGLRLAACTWALLVGTVLVGGLIYVAGAIARGARSRSDSVDAAQVRSTLPKRRVYWRWPTPSSSNVGRDSSEPLFVRVVGPFQDVLLYPSLKPGARSICRRSQESGTNAVWRRVPAPGTTPRSKWPHSALGNGMVLQVGKTTESRDAAAGRLSTRADARFDRSLAVSLVGGLLLTRSTLKPLRDLRDTVQRILRTGQTDNRVPITGADDAVEELGVLFNAMITHINTLIHGIAARSILSSTTESPHPNDPASRDGGIERWPSNEPRAPSRGAVGLPRRIRPRASSMLTTLMDISEAETGTMRLALDPPWHLGPSSTETVDLYEDAAEEAGVTLSSSVPEALSVRANRDRLRQALEQPRSTTP